MSIEVTRTSVHCDQRWHDFYRSIVGMNRSQALEVPFATMYNAFVAFACIGRFHDTFVPLESRREIFLAQYFDRRKHVPVLIALAYERLVSTGTIPDEAFATVISSNGFVPIVEGWANGGVQIFDESLRKGNPFATQVLVDTVMAQVKRLT